MQCTPYFGKFSYDQKFDHSRYKGKLLFIAPCLEIPWLTLPLWLNASYTSHFSQNYFGLVVLIIKKALRGAGFKESVNGLACPGDWVSE